MGEWNKGLYLLGQRSGGTCLGAPEWDDPSSVLLLEHRGAAMAVHGYQSPGMIRGTYTIHTCVTMNLLLERPLSLELRPKNAVQRLLPGSAGVDIPQIQQRFKIETEQKEIVRQLLRLPAVSAALLACPKTDVTISTLKSNEQEKQPHVLRLHTTYINDEMSWKDTVTLAELTPLELVERIAALARAIYDGLTDFHL